MRKLPKIGDSVALTRSYLANAGSAKADWRGVIVRECDYASPGWPMVVVAWKRGTNAPAESDFNAGNLCSVRSLAFVEM